MKLGYSLKDVKRWRDKRYRRTMKLTIRNEREALAFINDVGFCLASKSEDLELPNLWDAMTGGQTLNDSSRVQRRYYLSYAWEIRNIFPNHNSVYYGKVFRRRPTIISREFLAYFFALSERIGGRDEYKSEFNHGKLSGTAKSIMDVLMKNSPMTSKELRNALAGRAKSKTQEFDNALEELQRKMFVTRIVGNGTVKGATWSPVVKSFPAEVRKALKISVEVARFKLLEKYFHNQLICSIEDVHKTFGWSKGDIFHTLGKLIHAGVITTTIVIDGKKGQHYCLIH